MFRRRKRTTSVVFLQISLMWNFLNVIIRLPTGRCCRLNQLIVDVRFFFSRHRRVSFESMMMMMMTSESVLHLQQTKEGRVIGEQILIRYHDKDHWTNPAGIQVLTTIISLACYWRNRNCQVKWYDIDVYTYTYIFLLLLLLLLLQNVYSSPFGHRIILVDCHVISKKKKRKREAPLWLQFVSDSLLLMCMF